MKTTDSSAEDNSNTVKIADRIRHYVMLGGSAAGASVPQLGSTIGGVLLPARRLAPHPLADSEQIGRFGRPEHGLDPQAPGPFNSAAFTITNCMMVRPSAGVRRPPATAARTASTARPTSFVCAMSGSSKSTGTERRRR